VEKGFEYLSHEEKQERQQVRLFIGGVMLTVAPVLLLTMLPNGIKNSRVICHRSTTEYAFVYRVSPLTRLFSLALSDTSM
jgi:hypothetical protein